MDLAVAQRTNHQADLRAQRRGNVRPQAVFIERQHRLARLFDRHTLAQPGEGAEEGAGVGGAWQAAIQALREQHVGFPKLWHLKSFGQDANDACRLLVELDGASQYGRIAAERGTPQGVREEHHSGRAGAIVFRREVAAQFRSDAERPQEIGLHGIAGEAPRRFAGLEVALRAGFHGCERLEGLLHAAPIQVAACHVEFVVIDRPEEAHGDELVSLRVWQAAEQQRIDHAEDRRGSSDTNRDGGDGDGRKSGGAAKSAQGVPAVLQQSVPPEGHMDGTDGFERAQRSAKLPLGERAGLIRVNASGAMPLLAKRLVAIEFLAPFGFLPAPAAGQPREPFHANRSTFRTPFETVVQLVSASTRRRRPAGVRE